MRSAVRPRTYGAAMSAEVESLVAERGESNYPLSEENFQDQGRPQYVIHQVGIDQVRFVMSLSGDSARVALDWATHDWKPRGIPSMRFLGTPKIDGYARSFEHLLGPDGPRCLYHRESSVLHVDVHFPRLAAVSAAHEAIQGVIGQLLGHGIETLFPVKVARFDATGDVLFASPALYRHAYSAFESMLPDQGREVVPYLGSTLYLRTAGAKRAGRKGRVYDKGAERAARAGWSLAPNRYMRIEAEVVHEAAGRIEVAHLGSEILRACFLDRWGAVGSGTLRLKGGLVEPLMRLRQDGALTEAKYERLYTFLDHCRMGLARDLYERDTYLRRAKEARELGLEVPGEEGRDVDDLCEELDVRAIVHEIAAAF